MNDHAGDDRGKCRETKANEEWDSDGCRRTKSGRTFDEGTEEPCNDDHLNAAVGSDVDEPLADGSERATFFEGIQQQNGAENDVEKRTCHDQAVDARRRDLNAGNPPNEQRERDRHDVRQRHRASRGPTQDHQEQGDRENRQQGKEREDVSVHDVGC